MGKERWKKISEVNIPPLKSVGFQEDVIFREDMNNVKLILTQEMEEEKTDLLNDRNDEEEPTVLINQRELNATVQVNPRELEKTHSLRNSRNREDY